MAQKFLTDYVVEGTSPEELDRLCYLRKWTIDDVRAKRCTVLKLAMAFDQLESLKWLVSKFDVTIEDVHKNAVFPHGIQFGHTECVKLLVNHFDLKNSQNPFKFSSHLLSSAMWWDRLEFMEWIVNYFGLSVEDKYSHCRFMSALTNGVSTGNLECVKWLVKRFNLGVNNVHSYVFQRGIEKGKLETVRWVVEYLNVPAKDVHIENKWFISGLKVGIKEKKWEGVGWLIWWFGLDEDFEGLKITDEQRTHVQSELTKLRPRLVKAAVSHY